jgi:DNA-binding response OmpR family regulator
MDLHRKMSSSDFGARVLIVEDHPMIAELVETRLRIEGMRPTKCLGGREAIQVLGNADVDLVILDIMMPEVDGYEVFKFLKSQERTRDTPVIFLTAKSTQDDIEKGLAMGADCYITKPFSGADLVRKVKILLEQHRLRPAAHA